jgi:putative transposase
MSRVALMMLRGKPNMIRSDNGPEFIAQALQGWLCEMGSEVIYIEPGASWQNGYSESFHAQLRREFLDRTIFRSVDDARSSGTRYRTIWNTIRPHGALAMKTPAQYAASLTMGPHRGNPAST